MDDTAPAPHSYTLRVELGTSTGSSGGCECAATTASPTLLTSPERIRLERFPFAPLREARPGGMALTAWVDSGYHCPRTVRLSSFCFRRNEHFGYEYDILPTVVANTTFRRAV
jgi:hypothetical protein